MKAVTPPIGAQPKASCQHLLATTHDHRCPTCQGTLRRCCQSVIGYPHSETCHTRNP